MVLKRTGNVNLARRWVAIAGFVLSGAATIPAIFAHDPKVSVAFYCAAFFGLNGRWAYRGRFRWILAGISRLSFGGDEQPGKRGRGAVVVRGDLCRYALRLEFAVPADERALVIAALLYLKIDANKRIV